MRALGWYLASLLVLPALACCGPPPSRDDVTLEKCVDPDVVWTDLGFLGSEYCPPENWSGPVFTALTDYPKELGGTAVPWRRYNFQAGEAGPYLEAMLDYALSDGDLPINRAESPDWKPSTRRWFHAPWLNWGKFGREFAHGLTRERTSRPGELHPDQRDRFQNWAVSVFNARGGYALGQIWKDRRWPALDVSFPVDTFVVKFLFTEASVEQVPYLEGAPEWQAGIHVHWDRNYPPNLDRSLRTVRLLQVDVAAKDGRSPVGWVFGSFVYHREAEAEDPWRRLLPLGLAWGNSFSGEDGSAQMWIDPRTESLLLKPLREAEMRYELGWNGRLNGPVDDPRSSCISCHATAQVPRRMPETGEGDLGVKLLVAPDHASEDEMDQWFKPPPTEDEPPPAGDEPPPVFLPGSNEASIPGVTLSFDKDDLVSTDFSLQVMFGIENFRRVCRKQRGGCQQWRLQEESPQVEGRVAADSVSDMEEFAMTAPEDFDAEPVYWLSPDALDELRFDTVGDLEEGDDETPLMRDGG